MFDLLCKTDLSKKDLYYNTLETMTYIVDICASDSIYDSETGKMIYEDELIRLNGFLIDQSRFKKLTPTYIYKNTYGKVRKLFTDKKFVCNFMMSLLNRCKGNTKKRFGHIFRSVDIVAYNYFMWLAEELAENGFVTRYQITQQLTKLHFQHC